MSTRLIQFSMRNSNIAPYKAENSIPRSDDNIVNGRIRSGQASPLDKLLDSRHVECISN